MRRILLGVAAAAALMTALPLGVGAEPGNGCPGFQNSLQARAGQRAELVHQFRENALPGQTFGDIQTEFNRRVCGHGNP